MAISKIIEINIPTRATLLKVFESRKDKKIIIKTAIKAYVKCLLKNAEESLTENDRIIPMIIKKIIIKKLI
jgi:hypothetical protein